MTLPDGVEVIPRTFHTDDRGWLLKVLTGEESGLAERVGEVYLTFSSASQVRGNHFHELTSEWFTLIDGVVQLSLLDTRTGQSGEIVLDSEKPVTVHVPAGIAHAFVSTGGPMLLVAYADRPYDPEDTVACNLI